MTELERRLRWRLHQKIEANRRAWGYDATEIAPRLCVGSDPGDQIDRVLSRFDLLVLTSDTDQHHDRRDLVPPTGVLRAPMDDHELTPAELEVSMWAAMAIARKLVGGRSVLVTCHAGMNRSPFVAALALDAERYPTGDLIDRIRGRRPAALRTLSLLRTLHELRPLDQVQGVYRP